MVPSLEEKSRPGSPKLGGGDAPFGVEGVKRLKKGRDVHLLRRSRIALLVAQHTHYQPDDSAHLSRRRGLDYHLCAAQCVIGKSELTFHDVAALRGNHAAAAQTAIYPIIPLRSTNRRQYSAVRGQGVRRHRRLLPNVLGAI